MVPVENILKEALELPVDLRAQLARDLIRSLPGRVAEPDVPTTDSVDERSMTWEGGQGVLED